MSVAKNLKSAAKDDEWKQFTAKIIKQTKADVLPVYFDGKNGLLYHLFASKLKNQTLKYSSYVDKKNDRQRCIYKHRKCYKI